MISSPRVIAQKLNSKLNGSTLYSFTYKKFGTSSLGSESARPYFEIPGPKAFPFIGNVLRFLPGIGEYGGMKETEILNRLRAQYGKIVRLDGIPNRRACICLFDVELCERLYRLEGPWPMRISMECLHKYSIMNKDQREAGLANSQGEEWHLLRTQVNQPMMQPLIVRQYVEQVDRVARDFISRMQEMKDPQTLELPKSFNNELNKWALESVYQIALDHRLGCFEPNLSPDSDPQRMIQAVHELFDLVYQLEYLPSLWKYYNTRKLKRFFGVIDTLVEISNKHIDNAMERLKNKPQSDIQERTLLEQLLAKDKKTARTMAQDMLFAGIDTTDVVAMHGLLCKDEDQFPEPHKFIPERWTRDGTPGVRSAKDAHPFAYMPFSFGPRTCVGRRFAELEMQIIIARVIKKFILEWNHGPLELSNLGLNAVKTPLCFKLLDR